MVAAVSTMMAARWEVRRDGVWRRWQHARALLGGFGRYSSQVVPAFACIARLWNIDGCGLAIEGHPESRNGRRSHCSWCSALLIVRESDCEL